MGRGELGLLIHRHNKEAAVFSFSFSLKAALEEGVVFFIHFAKFRSSSKIAGMNSLRNAISQGAAGDSWVILICHLHPHTVHPHTVHTAPSTETLKHLHTVTVKHTYTPTQALRTYTCLFHFDTHTLQVEQARSVTSPTPAAYSRIPPIRHALMPSRTPKISDKTNTKNCCYFQPN